MSGNDESEDELDTDYVENNDHEQHQIISHIDLDCFYVQVERSHNSKLRNVPVAVVPYSSNAKSNDNVHNAPSSDERIAQTGNLIAVSYEARAKGVKRFMQADEAKRLCPEIVLIQVPFCHEKASLEIYRQASSNIMKVLSRRYPPDSIIIERASIDEVYLDVSNEAKRLFEKEEELFGTQGFVKKYLALIRDAPTLTAGDDNKEIKMSKMDIQNGHTGQTSASCSGPANPTSDATFERYCWFERSLSHWNEEDCLLLAGTYITQLLRQDVFSTLGFTCSAGIAKNKMLAKLASSMHKPNKQTIVPNSYVSRLMNDLPYTRVQGFGGKLGSEIVNQFGPLISKMGDLLSKVTREELSSKLGSDTAEWMIQKAKGIDLDPVQDRSLPISINCGKTYRNRMLTSEHVQDGTVLTRLIELSRDLTERINMDTECNHRQPKNVHVGASIRSLLPQHDTQSRLDRKWSEEISFSKTFPLPLGNHPDQVAKIALNLIMKYLKDNLISTTSGEMISFGIVYMSLTANQFERIACGKKSIHSYFQSNSVQPLGHSYPMMEQGDVNSDGTELGLEQWDRHAMQPTTSNGFDTVDRFENVTGNPTLEKICTESEAMSRPSQPLANDCNDAIRRLDLDSEMDGAAEDAKCDDDPPNVSKQQPSLRPDTSVNTGHHLNPAADSRIVAHVDLDCFYVQVERSHNPELLHKPVAVVQYNPFGDLKDLAPSDNRIVNSGSIIAVSYEARAKGVKRIMRGHEAKKVCPEMILVQVPTAHGKANLEIYRQASSNIMKVLSRRYPPGSIIIERASIDEVYLDVSNEAKRLFEKEEELFGTQGFVKKYLALIRDAPTLTAGDDNKEIKMGKGEIRNGYSGQGQVSAATATSDKTGAVEEADWLDRGVNEWHEEDCLLLAGTYITQLLRQDVFSTLGFTCSAGIAKNKMLAKLASSMHKPNKQTIVPNSYVSRLMNDLPYTRVQGFGGKLGSEIVNQFGPLISKMGDLLSKVTREELSSKFGSDTAEWMIQKAKGIDLDPVQDRSLPISIGCSKSFRSSKILTVPQLHDGTVLKWLVELSGELLERIRDDTIRNNRKPKQLHIGVSALLRSSSTSKTEMEACTSSPNQRVKDWHQEQGMSLSKSVRLPQGNSAEQIAKVSLQQIMKAISENPKIQSVSNRSASSGMQSFGLTYLSLSANQFETVHIGKQSIFTYLRPGNASVATHPDPYGLQTTSPEHGFLPNDSEQIETVDSNPTDIANEIETSGRVLLMDSSPDKSNEPLSSWSHPITNRTLPDALGTVSSPKNNSKSFEYNRYLREAGIDKESFMSLPPDMQREVIDDCMFNQSSQSKTTFTSHPHPKAKRLIETAGRAETKSKKKCEFIRSHGNMNLSSWLGAKK